MSAWRKVVWLGMGAAGVLLAEVLFVLLLRIDTASPFCHNSYECNLSSVS